MRSADRTRLETESAPPRSFASEAWAGSPEPARSLPESAYSSLAFQGEEDAAIWTRAWVCVGFAADVANPGDVLPFTVGNHGIHVERLADGSIQGRFNKAQHGGCRAVPLQCQTGTKTKCSFTGCGYSRDRAPIAATDPDRLLHLDQYLGLRPERLLPITLRTWGPLVVAQLDPTAEADFTWPEPSNVLQDAEVGLGGTIWVEYGTNWKHLAAGLAGRDASDRAKILFPNVVVLPAGDRLCLVVMQPTSLSKTLCRIRQFGTRSGTAQAAAHRAEAVPTILAERAAVAEAAQAGTFDTESPVRHWFDNKVMDAVERVRGESPGSTLFRTTDKGGW